MVRAITALALSLLASACTSPVPPAAAVSPRLGMSPEIIIDQPSTITPAAEAQTSASVAASDSGYLAVWEDRRSGAGTGIYGTRVALDGRVLDFNLPIATGLGFRFDPQVVWDGTTFLVTWIEPVDYHYRLAGARVT